MSNYIYLLCIIILISYIECQEYIYTLYYLCRSSLQPKKTVR